jgi:RimJ/RimL family protein N-acetyltransferase
VTHGTQHVAQPAAAWFDPVTLAGQHVRLEALAHGHVADLLAAAQDDDVWRWLPAGRPTTEQAMRQLVDNARDELARGHRTAWAIVAVDAARAIGSTSYLDIVPEHRRVEIGWTWLGRDWWRTSMNTEAKLLLLGRAFDQLGAIRVALKTDAANTRSQAAIERIGGVREGTLRAHMVRPDGTRRDSVYYSILRSEWPGVRARLESRVRER